MKSNAATVPEYLEELPADRKAALAKLRTLIKKAAPKIEESMQYGMPAYSMNGTLLFALASQKQYLALYVMDKGVVDEHRAELKQLDIGKGCIRFKKLEDLPLDVARAMVTESVERLRKGESRNC